MIIGAQWAEQCAAIESIWAAKNALTVNRAGGLEIPKQYMDSCVPRLFQHCIMDGLELLKTTCCLPLLTYCKYLQAESYPWPSWMRDISHHQWWSITTSNYPPSFHHHHHPPPPHMLSKKQSKAGDLVMIKRSWETMEDERKPPGCSTLSPLHPPMH